MFSTNLIGTRVRNFSINFNKNFSTLTQISSSIQSRSLHSQNFSSRFGSLKGKKEKISKESLSPLFFQSSFNQDYSFRRSFSTSTRDFFNFTSRKKTLGIGFGSSLLLGILFYLVQNEALAESNEEIQQEETGKVEKESEKKKPNEDQESEEESEDSNPISYNVTYLLVGSGIAIDAAIKGIRMNDPDGDIFVLCEDPPVGISTNDSNVTFLFGNPYPYFIDISESTVIPRDNVSIHYKKLLIAAEGTQIIQPEISETVKDRVKPTIDNAVNSLFQTFQELDAKKVVVIGGNLLATEIVTKLSYKAYQRAISLELVQVFPEKTLAEKYFPEYLSNFITEFLNNRLHIQTLPNRKVSAIVEGPDGKLLLECEDSSTLDADYVVIASGTRVNSPVYSSFIEQTKDGIVANTHLQSHFNIWVAGDMLSFYDRFLRIRRRDILNSASCVRESAFIAGINMSSSVPNHFVFQPYIEFYFGQHSLRAIGVVDSSLRTVAVMENPKDGERSEKNLTRGYIYYFDQNNQINGVILLNIAGRNIEASKILGRTLKSLERDNVKNILDIPEEEEDDDE